MLNLYCVVLLFFSVSIKGFIVAPSGHVSVSLSSGSYGRNSEIWPPTNEDGIKLEDSFANGVVPDGAQPVQSLKRNRVIRIPRILQRAAKAQEKSNFVGRRSDASPALLALVLLRWSKPLDLILICFTTGYLATLACWASSLNEKGRQYMPALPPQGHVPTLVDNPLGFGFQYSRIYDQWLQTGALLGLVGPLLWLIILGNRNTALDKAALGLVARPVLLLCAQATTESWVRRWVWPLPLRILVPVVYNTMRLGYYYQWAVQTSMMNVLAVSNLLYWSVNLFGFLLPVAVMRYLRAHFFVVEAEQVALRDKDSIGLTI